MFAHRPGSPGREAAWIGFACSVSMWKSITGSRPPRGWRSRGTGSRNTANGWRQTTRRLLGLLDQAKVRATFFVVGDIARTAPALVRAIHAAGHEVGSHGWKHTRVDRFTPAAFRDDARNSKDALEQVTGAAVVGFRAPTFSITRRTPWAIDVLAECGYEYDSSIFPVHHDRYGVPNAPRGPFQVAGRGADLLELPPLTYRLAGFNWPVAGGGYFRLFPLGVMRAGIRQVERDDGPSVAMLYFHPWEFDEDQPRLPLGRLARWRTYVGIRRTMPRLQSTPPRGIVHPRRRRGASSRRPRGGVAPVRSGPHGRAYSPDSGPSRTNLTRQESPAAFQGSGEKPPAGHTTISDNRRQVGCLHTICKLSFGVGFAFGNHPIARVNTWGRIPHTPARATPAEARSAPQTPPTPPMNAQRRLVLVAADPRHALTFQAHLQRALQLTAPVIRFEDLPELLSPETDGDVLLFALDPADVPAVETAVREAKVQQFPVRFAVVESEQVRSRRLLDHLAPYIANRLLWPAQTRELAVWARRALEPGTSFADPATESIAERLRRRLINQTPSLSGLVDQLCIAAQHDVSVLIEGESGTGKSTIARMIHDSSARATNRFAGIACGALTPAQLGQELYGQAQSGAEGAKIGKLAAVADGTVLLDEVDTLER